MVCNLPDGTLWEYQDPGFQQPAAAVKKCIKDDLSTIDMAVPSAKKTKLKMADILESLMEGAHLGNHIFDKYK